MFANVHFVPVLFGVVAIMFAGVGIITAVIPAHRVMRVPSLAASCAG